MYSQRNYEKIKFSKCVLIFILELSVISNLHIMLQLYRPERYTLRTEATDLSEILSLWETGFFKTIGFISKNRLVFSRNTISSIYLLKIWRLVSVLLYHLPTFLNKISRAVLYVNLLTPSGYFTFHQV